jgi:hypothetical protein
MVIFTVHDENIKVDATKKNTSRIDVLRLENISGWFPLSL